MKILLTGGTGFLGKAVLSKLLVSQEVERVWVLSRKTRTHPDPRVMVLQAELTEAGSLRRLAIDPDHIIHLAGLYDFRASASELYLQNVVATLHLLEQMKAWIARAGKIIPLHLASTYAVAYRDEQMGVEDERPQEGHPPTRSAYPYTKAMVERLVLQSRLPSRIFRLGILVAAPSDRSIEKMDGPYSFLSLLDRMKDFFPSIDRLSLVPVPAHPDGSLPLVPVDAAASVFARSVLELALPQAAEIYGVYESGSIPMGEFVTESLRRLGYRARPFYLKKVPPFFLRAQARLTAVPAGVFEFALRPPRLSNPRFLSVFGEDAVPSFRSYQDQFFAAWRSEK